MCVSCRVLCGVLYMWGCINISGRATGGHIRCLHRVELVNWCVAGMLLLLARLVQELMCVA